MMKAIMKEKNGEHPFGDFGQIVSFALFLVIWVVDSFLIRKTIFFAEIIPLSFRLVVMTLSMVSAILLFRSSHFVAHAEQRMRKPVTTGAFRYVRHPLYLASLLTYFGLAVSTFSLLSFVSLALIFLFYDYIASYEEQFMENRFNEEYRVYKRKTGKWAPRFRVRDGRIRG